ncbi:sulfite exporter TauE/SafE [bacterium BMS3Bbin06]|nr:sulfite exporter TauE/SafE [bacterium BMS3Abin08]GBE34567.1 sulfite exporter TauE/SafE [bacterium BMS3Bbin06]
MLDILDLVKVTFPVSGVETYIFIPPIVAFLISFFTSMAGVSGAFLLLPFQISALGFTTPSVTSTNFLYNLVGIPGGVYRYTREGRMAWPLTVCIVLGTLPGVFVGYYIRIRYLPDPRDFKFFVGLVLLYIGYRLLLSMGHNSIKNSAGGAGQEFRITDVSYSLRRVRLRFCGEEISFSVLLVFSFSLLVGIIGGIYGIGGGAIIAPFLVSVLDIPVYVFSGAVLMGTFMTSIFGLLFYSTLPLKGGVTAPPDWLLGVLFGIGGLCGMYLGARVQRHVPTSVIKLILALVVLVVSGKYILQFFR